MIGCLNLKGLEIDLLPHRVKRIASTDVYAVASFTSITFVKISSIDNPLGKKEIIMEELYTIQNLHTSMIEDFDFWGNLMISTSQTI